MVGKARQRLVRNWAAALLAAMVFAVTLTAGAIAPQTALAQQLPGPAQPGIPLVTPPVIPKPAVPPSVVPEAEPLAPPPGAETIRFVLTDLKLEGVTVYAPEQLKPLYAGLLGHEVALTEIFRVADAITTKYRTDGYILSRAVVPAQKVENGTVTIQVLEGYVDKVTVQGKAPKIVTDYADRIRRSRPLTASALERYLLLANDLPGVTARAVLLPSKTTPDAADLLVTVETKPVNGFATIDNRGSRYVGPVQSTRPVQELIRCWAWASSSRLASSPRHRPKSCATANSASPYRWGRKAPLLGLPEARAARSRASSCRISMSRTTPIPWRFRSRTRSYAAAP
jgi:hemolysin activation/secretion protein